jgi:hypothetical protein
LFSITGDDVDAGDVEVTTTETAYVVPLVSPSIRHEVPVVVQVSPPGFALTV